MYRNPWGMPTTSARVALSAPYFRITPVVSRINVMPVTQAITRNRVSAPLVMRSTIAAVLGASARGEEPGFVDVDVGETRDELCLLVHDRLELVRRLLVLRRPGLSLGREVGGLRE